MNDFSYWETKYFWQPAQYVIVGSGITGLTTAIFLRKNRPKARVVILERGALPSGASTKNAGFACFGSISEILDDIATDGEDAVFSLIVKRLDGLHQLRQLLGDESLNYEASGGYEIFLPDEIETHKKCVAAIPFLNEKLKATIGHAPFAEADEQIPKLGLGRVEHLIFNSAEGLIDTGKMMHSLIQLARELGVEIHTGVEVKHIHTANNGVQLDTSFGTFKAEMACVATNGFAERLLPHLDVKPCRAQVLITQPIPGLRLHGAFHHNSGYDYFRHLDGRVLLGGGRNLDKTGEQRDDFGLSDSIQQYLEKLLGEVILPYTPFEIDMRWSGIMGIGKSKEVIVKEVDKGVFCAVRFGGMGVALGTAVGNEVAQRMLGKA